MNKKIYLYLKTKKKIMKKVLSVLLILLATITYGQKGVEILGPEINSNYNEFRPIASGDGNTLFFTVEGHPANLAKNGQDIWVSRRDTKGMWTKAERLPDYINTGRMNNVFWTSVDGNKIIFRSYQTMKGDTTRITLQDYMYSIRDCGFWSRPTKLQIPGLSRLTQITVSSLTMSTDEKVIILSLSSAEDGRRHNLYISKFDEKTKEYSVPQIIKSISDSTGGEFNPFLAADDNTLYFSAKRKGGLGQNDIWMSRRIGNSWTEWTPPVNLNRPINSRRSDLYFSVGDRGKVGYVVSNEMGLFRKKQDIGKIQLADTLQPKVWIEMFGDIYDAVTKKPVKASVTAVTAIDDSSEIETKYTNNSRKYKFRFAYGSDVVMYVSADGYHTMVDTLKIIDRFGAKDIWRDIYLTSQSVIDSICAKRSPCDPLDTLDTDGLYAELAKSKILFDFASSVLRTESYRPLQILAKILKKNPNMIVELGGHTDAVGIVNKNIAQSEERAESARLYLLSIGVNPNQVVSKGYADETPIAPNTTDEGRQLNRRVDFKVISQ